MAKNEFGVEELIRFCSLIKSIDMLTGTPITDYYAELIDGNLYKVYSFYEKIDNESNKKVVYYINKNNKRFRFNEIVKNYFYVYKRNKKTKGTYLALLDEFFDR